MPSDREIARTRIANAKRATQPNVFAGASKEQRRTINMGVLPAARRALAERLSIEQKLVYELKQSTQQQIRQVFYALKSRGVMNQLADEAAHESIRRKTITMSRKELREILLAYARSDAVKERAERSIRDAADSAGASIGKGVLEALRPALALWYVSGAEEVSNLIDPDRLKAKYAGVTVLKANASGYTDIDILTVEYGVNDFQELYDAITSRLNLITLPGFTDAMFETVRDTILQDLYANVDGSLGARQIARDVGEALIDKYGAALPAETENRLMLWARTEGAVMQNDALLATGKSAGMDGKIWFSAGDNRVRDAHVLNESDGVIPVTQDFSDGSSDAGSGSVSPYNCRCTSAPAMLEDKKERSYTDIADRAKEELKRREDEKKEK